MKRFHFHNLVALIFLLLAVLFSPWVGKAGAQNSYKFDFGVATSEPGYVLVNNTLSYTAARGYGWVATTGLGTRDRSTTDDLQRDFVLGSSAQTFRVSGLTPGRYLMKVLCGDLSYGDHVVTVSVPGAGTLPTMSPRINQFLLLSATVETTGTLNITFGSSTNNWIVNALTLEPAASTITPVIESANLSEWDSKVFANDPTQALLEAFGSGSGTAQATGLTRADYLTLIASEVDFWKTKQNSSGAIIDPYANGEIQYTTPAFAHAAALLVAYGNRADLLEPASKAMDWASLRLSQRLAANGHEDFYPVMLAHAYKLLKPYAAANRSATWATNISSIDPYAIYRQAMGSMNWNIVSSSGEYLFQTLGLRTTNTSYVDESLGAQGRHFTSPYGLYLEGPMPYDHFPRIFLADILAQGYNGAYKGELETAIGRAAVTSLFMQSPHGELPSGGRSAHHQWNEAEQCVTYEIYAARAQVSGNAQLTGTYKRAAHLALASMKRWVRPSGEMQILKNWVDPAQRHGYESYSYYSQYNLLPMSMLASAYEYAATTENVAERPAPADTGGFVFQIPELNKVFANAGGTYVELDTTADHHYDATGLIRVHMKDVPPQLGPSDSLMSAAAYNSPNPSSLSTGVGVAWQDSAGTWHTLGEMGSTEITSVTVTPLAQSRACVAFDVTYQGSMAGVSRLVEHYVLTPDGVQLTTELSGYNGALRYIWPVLSNDGKTKSTISTIDKTVSVSQSGGVAQTFTAVGAQSVRVEANDYSNHNGWARLGIAEYPNGGKITLLIGQLETSPQDTFNVLFSDSFDRTDNGTVGINDNRLGGNLTATYGEKETASVASNQLLLSGDASGVTPNLNFNQSSITSGGFADIEFDCNPVSNTSVNGSGWVGLTLGQSAAPTGAAYNTTSVNKDFSLLMRDNGQFQALSTGANVIAPDTTFDSAPSAAEPETYRVRLRVATKSFETGAPFTISATLSGQLDAVAGEDTATLDLNGTAAGTSYSGTWTGTGNFVTLESDATSTIDNLTISALTGGTVSSNVSALFWKGDMDGNWNTNVSGNTNWASNTAGTIDPNQLSSATTDLVFAATGASNLANTVLGADVSAKSLTITAGTPVGIGGTQKLALGVGGLTMDSNAGATTINTTGGMNLEANQSWTNNSTNPLTVSSPISGNSFGLTTAGSGTVVLGGTNTYNGATTVNAGTLNVTGSIANSALSVSSGGTLSGTGTLGATILASGATHAPGVSGPGIEKTGAYTNNGVLSLDIAGTTVGIGYDQVNVTGSVTWGGALKVMLPSGYTPNLNDKFVLISNDGSDAITPASGSIPEGGLINSTDGRATFQVSYRGGDGNDLVLTNTSSRVTSALISEFRLSGPSGAQDEFIEIGNNTNANLDLTGWTLTAGGATINLSGFIPERGYSLVAGNAYSLGGYALGDRTLDSSTDIPLNAVLTLRNASGVVVDVVNTGGALVPSNSTSQYSFVRKFDSGVAQDTGTDGNDFNLVDISSTNSTSDASGVAATVDLGGRLGAPGPQSVVSASPTQRNNRITYLPLAGPAANATVKYQGTATYPVGQLSLRRTITNNSGKTVTKMRFRLAAVTAGASNTATAADLRAISSTGVVVNGVAVQALQLDAPSVEGGTNNGGGLNSTWSVTLPGSGLTSGSSVNVEFLFGVVKGGAYKAVIDTELAS